MTGVVFVASLAVFCALQAVYWIVRNRRATRTAALVDRLGVDESMLQANALLRAQEGGAFEGLVSLLEEAGEGGEVGPFFSRMAVFFLATFAVFLILTQSVGAGLLFGSLATTVPLLGLFSKKRKRIARIEEQLPEALEVMTISLRAGQSLDQTIRLTAQELDAPIGEEFQRVAEENEFGRPLEEALVAMSVRLKDARTVRTFVTSVLVLRQTGGNLIEVLESIIDTMRQQSQYERKLQSMTAEGRSSSRMLGALPPLFVTVAWLANPGYIGRLLTDPVGQVMLFISVTLYLTGLVWVRRMVNPKSA